MEEIKLKEEYIKLGQALKAANPVSYTHLDVYKRQPITHTGTHRTGMSLSLSLFMISFSLKRNHHMSVRIFALTSGHHIFVVLKSGMDNPSLIRVHRLQ